MTPSQRLEALLIEEPHHRLREKRRLLNMIFNPTEKEKSLKEKFDKIKQSNSLTMQGKKPAKVEHNYIKKKKSKYGF
jgi:hypothetical protein